MSKQPALLVDWKRCGPAKDPKSILRGAVALFGKSFVATAVGVEFYDIPCALTGDVKGKGQRGATPLADVELIKWNRVSDALGCYETIFIEERPYVVFIRPELR